MASNQTSNYGLNQWEAGDRVMREEFNRDNLNIDLALANKLGRSQLIRTAVCGDRTKTLMVDLSDISWEEWEYVAISLDVPPNQIADKTAFLKGTLNNGTVSGYCSYNISNFFYNGPCSFLLVLFPRHDGEAPVQGVVIGDCCGFCVGRCNFSDLTSLGIDYTSSTYYLTPGLVATVWGTR